jgi:hypothetical protein
MELADLLQYTILQVTGGTEENTEPHTPVRSELLRRGLHLLCSQLFINSSEVV